MDCISEIFRDIFCCSDSDNVVNFENDNNQNNNNNPVYQEYNQDNNRGKTKMDRWRGKVAVVTGASVGIGAAIVRLLAQEGMVVVGLARRVEKVEQLSKNLNCKPGGRIVAMKCDVSKEEEIFSTFEWVKNNIGHTYVLVNNAGIFFKGTMVDAKPENMRKVVETNLIGLAVCSQVAMKQMIEKKIDGHIIHISSIAGHWPLVGNPPVFNIYSPTKFAVKTLTEVMRLELNHLKLKIRVSAISPGLVDTEIFDMAGVDDGQLDNMLMLESKDIANAVQFVLETPPHVLIEDVIIRPLLSF